MFFPIWLLFLCGTTTAGAYEGPLRSFDGLSGADVLDNTRKFQRMDFYTLADMVAYNVYFFNFTCPVQPYHFFVCNYDTPRVCVCNFDREMTHTQASCDRLESSLLRIPGKIVKMFRFRIYDAPKMPDFVLERDMLDFFEEITKIKKERVFIFRKKCVFEFGEFFDLYLSVTYDRARGGSRNASMGYLDEEATTHGFRKNMPMAHYLPNLETLLSDLNIKISSIIMLDETLTYPSITQRVKPIRRIKPPVKIEDPFNLMDDFLYEMRNLFVPFSYMNVFILVALVAVVVSLCLCSLLSFILEKALPKLKLKKRPAVVERGTAKRSLIKKLLQKHRQFSV